MQLPLRQKTITGWVIACVLFIGLLGYEWMPASLRGGWIFYLLLVISGAFVEIGTALIVGLLAFMGSSLYLLYKLYLGLPAEKQALMMFLSPIAPLWLSAIKHNLRLRRDVALTMRSMNQIFANCLQRLEGYEDFEMRVQALCRELNIAGYVTTQIDILNQELISELLGGDIWVRTKYQVTSVLQATVGQPIFHFADENFSKIISLDLTHGQLAEVEPAYIAELRNIVELNLEISRTWHSLQDT